MMKPLTLTCCFLLAVSLALTAQTVPSATKEFIDGKVVKFTVKGHPKSKGASFTIKYPVSWQAKEGERPNVVQNFVSDSGKGFEMAMIITKAIPPNEPFTEADVQELFSIEGLKQMVPRGGKFLSAKPTRIENEPAGIVEYSTLMQRAGYEVELYSSTLMFFQKRTLVSVQFQVGPSPISTDSTAKRYAAFRPLFTLMMNSIVFDDKWK